MPSKLLSLLYVVRADEWADFKAKYGKAYNGDDEDHLRRAIFEDTMQFINGENAKDLSYQLAVNQFADWTSKERESLVGFKKNSRWTGLPRLGDHDPGAAAAPSALDWVTNGSVTPVKDQGQCGSCWAFSTMGSLEGAWQISSGKLVSLSEQQLVDCSKNGNEGCNGGLMDYGFEFLEDVNVCTEDSYPYKAADGSCDSSSCTVAIPRGGVTGYKDVTGGEDGLLSAVQLTPVSVAIEADQSSFQFYSSGILTGACGTNLDHGVLVVGYGTDSGKDYWKVKNSWGSSWGDNGYIRIERGSNKCGIASQASYPLVDSTVPPSPPAPTPPVPPPTPPVTTSQPPASKTCPFPAVQDCYTRSVSECWSPMLSKSSDTKAALDTIPDADVVSGIEKLLVDGDEFKKIWTVTVDGDQVHLTAYKFEAIGFEEDYQFAEATLQLNAGSNPAYYDAYEKFTELWDNHFYQKCVMATSSVGVTLV